MRGYEETHGAANSAPRWTRAEVAASGLYEVGYAIAATLVPIVAWMVT